jgi:hypothetical protein
MKLQDVIKYAQKQDSKHESGKSFLEQVKVKHRDGSAFKFRFAKTEILEMHLIVYTEHNGISYFNCEDILYAKTKLMLNLFNSKGIKLSKKYKFLVEPATAELSIKKLKK